MEPRDAEAMSPIGRYTEDRLQLTKERVRLNEVKEEQTAKTKRKLEITKSNKNESNI